MRRYCTDPFPCFKSFLRSDLVTRETQTDSQGRSYALKSVLRLLVSSQTSFSRANRAQAKSISLVPDAVLQGSRERPAKARLMDYDGKPNRNPGLITETARFQHTSR